MSARPPMLARALAAASLRRARRHAVAERAAGAGAVVLLSLSSISILPEADRLLDRKPAYQLDQLRPIARQAPACGCFA